MNESTQFDIQKALLITTMLLAIGAGLKHKCPWLPNKYIPAVTFVLGVAAYLFWTGDFSTKNVVFAIYVAFTATGAHSSGQSLTSPTTPKEAQPQPPPSP